MGWVADGVESIRSLQIRQVLNQIVSLGMIVTSALIIWKGLMCVTGSESPVVVVLSGSMEPGFKRGDILFLHMSKDPIRAGEIVVFNVDVSASIVNVDITMGREIPIVHRVIKCIVYLSYPLYGLSVLWLESGPNHHDLEGEEGDEVFSRLAKSLDPKKNHEEEIEMPEGLLSTMVPARLPKDRKL
ncbi:hypothetical protein ZIOFF_043933 [Zingiber officinale]|uniref:Signal peptidase complex catalytic subunit SEC11 n=1 Tax=Zingiber officinale TaxID=94328 RepID=A0A8J5FUA2_ZINOF|nr:hypothetical protein ZIOFF_043933 [Zingiber officinale]